MDIERAKKIASLVVEYDRLTKIIGDMDAGHHGSIGTQTITMPSRFVLPLRNMMKADLDKITKEIEEL